MLSVELPELSNQVLASAINRLSKEKKLQMVQNPADNSITYKEVEAGKSARYSWGGKNNSVFLDGYKSCSISALLQAERSGGRGASSVPVHRGCG